MSQLHDVETFIAASKRTRSLAELRGLLDDITRELDFDYFALMHHVELSNLDASHGYVTSETLIAMTTYPTHWVEEFIRDNMVVIDPILLASRRSATGFAWNRISEMIHLTTEQRNIRLRAVEAGIVDGFTVPAHVPGETNGSCSFAVKENRALRSDNLLMAELVGSHAFQAARDLVRRGGTTSSLAGPSLTSRQRDCVWLASQGHSDRKIADLLAISIETVKQHLKESRERLRASNRAQLVVRAAYHGIIPLTPMTLGPVTLG